MYLDDNLLQGNDGNVVALIEGIAKSIQPSTLFSFNVVWSLFDRLFELAGNRNASLQRSLAFDVVYDAAAVAVGRHNLRNNGLSTPTSAKVS